MKVFLDDARPAPAGWVRVHWPDEAIRLLEGGLVEEISLDHDLGDDALGTGYDVILWIEEAVAVRGFRPPKIFVHSANPAAREKMEMGIAAIERMASARPVAGVKHANETARWVWRAERDFALAVQVRDTYPEMAAFHFQQAAEKHLKACLVHRQVPINKTHDIGTLVSLASDLDPAFAKLATAADLEAISSYADDEIDLPTSGELDAAQRFCALARQLVIEQLKSNN